MMFLFGDLILRRKLTPLDSLMAEVNVLTLRL